MARAIETADRELAPKVLPIVAMGMSNEVGRAPERRSRTIDDALGGFTTELELGRDDRRRDGTCYSKLLAVSAARRRLGRTAPDLRETESDGEHAAHPVAPTLRSTLAHHVIDDRNLRAMRVGSLGLVVSLASELARWSGVPGVAIATATASDLSRLRFGARRRPGAVALSLPRDRRA